MEAIADVGSRAEPSSEPRRICFALPLRLGVTFRLFDDDDLSMFDGDDELSLLTDDELSLLTGSAVSILPERERRK